MSNQPYIYSLSNSDLKRKFLKDQNFRLFSKVLIHDDVYAFYPYAQVHFKDEAGAIIENSFFTEGLEFDSEIKNEDDESDFIKHKYLWSDSPVINARSTANISGINALVLVSAYYMKDKEYCRGYQGLAISDIVRQIALTDYKILPTDLKIGQTIGMDKWLQLNTYNRDFINKILCQNAYSQSYRYSPFQTFFNSRGEFYFMSLTEMYNQQPVNSMSLDYEFKFDETSPLDPAAVKRNWIMFGGLPINKESGNYKRNIYKFDKTSSSQSTSVDYLSDHCIKSDQQNGQISKIPIKRIYETDYPSYAYYGLYDSIKDVENFKGRVNALYRDSIFNCRMEVIVSLNPKLACGRTINLKLTANTRDGQDFQELCGKWLIMQSTHFLDYTNQPYTKLVLGRSGLNIDKNNDYYNDFITLI